MGKFSNNIQRVTVIGSMGQSLEDGRALDSELDVTYKGVITDAFIYQKTTFNSTDNGSWVTLEYNENDTFKSTPTSPLISPESSAVHAVDMYLMKDYVALKTKPIYVIKMGRGGTDLNGTTAATWDELASPSLTVRWFDWLFERGINDLVSQGKYVDFECIFWQQGFSDCDTQAHADAYNSNWNAWETFLRSQLARFGESFENVQIYIQQSPDWDASGARATAPYNALIAAQVSVGGNDNVTLLSNALYKDKLLADNIHLNDAAYRLIRTQRLAVLT